MSDIFLSYAAPTPEGLRNARLWMLAGAIGVIALGAAIYLVWPTKGGYSTLVPNGPRHIAGQTLPNPKDGLMYVYIPPGKFTMGCSLGDSECTDDEKPAHEVTIRGGFWLGQTPVTQKGYQRVIGMNPSHFKGVHLPVEQVTWNEAQIYCTIVGMRLPTEAEWEYAARAGSTGARYGDLDQIAWYSGNSGGKIHEVGQKQPNVFGLYDMLGNVLQWVADWYDEKYYEKSPGADPAGPASGTSRVLRGGAWGGYPRSVRASLRFRREPTVRYRSFGFRCAGESR